MSIGQSNGFSGVDFRSHRSGGIVIIRNGNRTDDAWVPSDWSNPPFVVNPFTIPNARIGDYTNEYFCPVGRDVGVISVLLKESIVDSIYGSESTKHVVAHFLQAESTEVDASGAKSPTSTTRIKLSTHGMLAESPTRITRGTEGSNASIFHCRFYDCRSLWLMSSVNQAYNLRMVTGISSDDGTTLTHSDYMVATLNSGSPWTVREVIDDLWSKLPSSWVTDGYRPQSVVWNSSSATTAIADSICVGVRFHGQDVWSAINDIVEYYMLSIVFDPWNNIVSVVKQDNSLTIDKQDDVDSANVRNGIGSCLYYSGNYSRPVISMPEKIVVYMPSPMPRGAEQSAFRDFNQSAMPAWAYEYTTNHPGAIAGTKLSIYDGVGVNLTTPAETYASLTDSDYYLGEGTPSRAEQRALEVAEDFAEQLVRSVNAGVYVSAGWFGINPINAVTARRFLLGKKGPEDHLINDPSMFPAIRRHKATESYLRDSVLKPRLNRPLDARDFDVMQVVQVWDDTKISNERVTATSGIGNLGYAFPGRVLRPFGSGSPIDGTTDEWEKCWITLVYGGNLTGSSDTTAAAQPLMYSRNCYAALGRLVGVIRREDGGVTYTEPHYVVYQNYSQCAEVITFFAAETFGYGDATFEAFVKTPHSGSDPSIGVTVLPDETYARITVYNEQKDKGVPGVYGFAAPAGRAGFAKYDYVTDKYTCFQVFC